MHDLDVDMIVSRYKSGESVNAISLDYGVSPSVVKLRLVKAGEAIRSSREATLARLKNGGRKGGRPRRYFYKSDFFDNSSSVVNYVIGLFQADGSNYPQRGRLSITLKSSDAYLLLSVAEHMGCPGKRLCRNKVGGSLLEIYDRRLSSGLAARGVVSPKTFSARTPADLLFDRDYWRGVIDGDGTLCTAKDGRRILSLVGTKVISTEFLDFCRSCGLGEGRSVNRHKSIWSSGLSGDEAMIMASILYDNSGLALARKQNTARLWSS